METATLCNETIDPKDSIKLIAKDKDALHLASAVYGGCKYFITCDDKFIKHLNCTGNR